MTDIQKFVTVTRAKSDLLEIIREVEEDDSTVALTKNGVPAAVILSMEKFEGLLETLDVLSNEETMESLKKSIRQGRLGKWASYDEVFDR